MSTLRILLRRIGVWMTRLSQRKGYGIHSPFAFRLLTEVVHQPLPYYAYDQLLREERRRAPHKPKSWRREPLRVKRLLFRLANEVKADYLLDVGPEAASALYLQAARPKALYNQASSVGTLFLEAHEPIHLLYLHDYDHPEQVEQVFRLCVERVVPQSLFVVEGIGYTPAMRALWEQMRQDPRVGITFDLFDVGLLFFDRQMQKQHYKGF